MKFSLCEGPFGLAALAIARSPGQLKAERNFGVSVAAYRARGEDRAAYPVLGIRSSAIKRSALVSSP
jgi:hypothetical protein